MTEKKTYLIDYHDLSDGVHEFELPITDELFVGDTESEVSSGVGTINVAIKKHGEIGTMEVAIEGIVRVSCDRCLDDCGLPVLWDSEASIRITDEIEEYDGGTVFLKTTDPYLDLTSYLYESIILSLPISRMHENITDCNQDVIKYISTIIE